VPAPKLAVNWDPKNGVFLDTVQLWAID